MLIFPTIFYLSYKKFVYVIKSSGKEIEEFFPIDYCCAKI